MRSVSFSILPAPSSSELVLPMRSGGDPMTVRELHSAIKTCPWTARPRLRPPVPRPRTYAGARRAVPASRCAGSHRCEEIDLLLLSALLCAGAIAGRARASDAGAGSGQRLAARRGRRTPHRRHVELSQLIGQTAALADSSSEPGAGRAAPRAAAASARHRLQDRHRPARRRASHHRPEARRARSAGGARPRARQAGLRAGLRRVPRQRRHRALVAHRGDDGPAAAGHPPPASQLEPIRDVQPRDLRRTRDGDAVVRGGALARRPLGRGLLALRRALAACARALPPLHANELALLGDFELGNRFRYGATACLRRAYLPPR